MSIPQHALRARASKQLSQQYSHLKNAHYQAFVRSSSTRGTSSTRSRSALWAGGFGCGIAVATYQMMDFFGGSEGLYRALSFYSLAIPKYAQYRFHQSVLHSPQHVWDEMDRQTSQQGLEKILQLRGFFIKCGQLAAANVGDGFPEIWQRTLSVLQDQCPPVDYETVILPILQDAYKGRPFPFQSIDPVPIGTASIGQVHRGVLAHNGESVVIKILLPHAERLLRGDVRTILAFCKIAQPVHVPNLKKVEQQLVENELDYRKEAQQMEYIRANLAGTNEACVVPRAHRAYCTKNVLVMEELVGAKLIDALREDGEKWQALAKEHGTNDDVDMTTALTGLDSARRVNNVSTAVYNWTVGWVATPKPYQGKQDLPLDHTKLVDDIFRIHGQQVLVDGRYNADCHPGNILLCRKPDGSPLLGLIDYGQVQVLTQQERLLFCKIIIALGDENRDEVVRLMTQAGFRSKKMDPDVIWLYSKVNYDQDNKELTNGKHIQMFMEELQSRDPIIELPESYLMVSRMSTLLRGLAHSLKQSRSVAKEWRPIAEKVLRENEANKTVQARH